MGPTCTSTSSTRVRASSVTGDTVSADRHTVLRSRDTDRVQTKCMCKGLLRITFHDNPPLVYNLSVPLVKTRFSTRMGVQGDAAPDPPLTMPLTVADIVCTESFKYWCCTWEGLDKLKVYLGATCGTCDTAHSLAAYELWSRPCAEPLFWDAVQITTLSAVCVCRCARHSVRHHHADRNHLQRPHCHPFDLECHLRPDPSVLAGRLAKRHRQ